jgi:hypothetical protein
MLRNTVEFVLVGLVGIVAGPMFAMQVADYITSLRGFTLRKPTKGQGLVEYALILFLIVVVVIAALTLAGGARKLCIQGGLCPTPTPTP